MYFYEITWTKVPSVVDFIILCTTKMFDSTDYEFLLPNYKAYEQKYKSNYKKTYQIEYMKNQNNQSRNRYREDALQKYGDY